MEIDTRFSGKQLRVHIGDVVIFCHGLPYESGSVIEKGYDLLAKKFSESGLNSLIFDFSGTGLSEGEFSIKNWVNDLIEIVNNFNSVKIVGFSMGGVVSTYVTAKSNNVTDLVLVGVPCCFDSITEDMLNEIYTHNQNVGALRGIEDFESFKDNFMKDMRVFEPKLWIDKIKIPKLIVHGTSDQIIDYKQGEMLFDMAKDPKYFLKVVNGSHFLRQQEEVIKKIIDWLIKKEKYGKVIQEIFI